MLKTLASGGTRPVAPRAAGFNNVDLASAGDVGITVVRVPAYSPNAVAEHTIGLMLSLDRKMHRAHARVREGNFSLDGFLGSNLSGKVVGVVARAASARSRRGYWSLSGAVPWRRTPSPQPRSPNSVSNTWG